MLSDDEKRYLVERLLAHVATLEKPRETLAAPFIGTSLPAQLATGTPHSIVNDIVRLCLADGWSNTPPWIVLLISVMPVDQTDLKLVEIRDRVSIKPPPPVNRLATTILDNGTPFVNRDALRSRLSRLASPAAKARPILVVTGPAKSGKSYSTEYIDHFSYNHQSPTTTYRVDLRPGTEFETGPEEVAIELVTQMGRPQTQKPKPNTNLKLFCEQLALWVMNEAVQLPTQSWLVLDGFHGEKLRADTRDLLVSLADKVTKGVFRDKCRLILIGFDQSVLTTDFGRVDHEHIAAVVSSDIAACVKEIATRSPSPIAEPYLLTFVSRGLPTDEARMKEMNCRLRTLILAIDEVGELARNKPDLDFDSVFREMLLSLPSGTEGVYELRRRLDALRASAVAIAP